ncbi:hypothetical protein IAT40_005833 [Kwoniella sp. CBS 6097]
MSLPVIATASGYKGLFPAGFPWGYASASYQIEGARNERGDCLWDRLLIGRDNGDVAADSFHLFEEDIKLLKAYGATAYRFSISWPRVIPKGGAEDPINQAGLDYYIKLVDRLLEEGIEPWVTIYHWDTPIDLEERYGGWVDHPQFYKDWLRFCSVCFEALGGKVKNWMTFNEPRIFVKMYIAGLDPNFDRRTDSFKLGRVVLLAHAKAVELYRNHYQPKQGGQIGMVLDADWVEPIDDSKEAARCAYEAVEAHFGWFADPIYNGVQNEVMKQKFGDALPEFSPEEMALIHNSSDFFGLNHYGTTYATGKDVSREDCDPLTYTMACVERTFNDKDGKPIGIRGQNGHPHIVAWGFRKLLRLIQEKYIKKTNLGIFIAENGFPVDGEAEMPLEQIVRDTDRQTYFAEYIKELADAYKEDNIKVDGYIAWSLIDNLEWMAGYYPRFGVTHIDRGNGCKRTPKDSAKFLKSIFEHLVAQS